MATLGLSQTKIMEMLSDTDLSPATVKKIAEIIVENNKSIDKNVTSKVLTDMQRRQERMGKR